MELTTILGCILGLVSVIGAMIFKRISFTVFLNPAAFFVIIVGTVATILNSFPGRNLKSLGKLFKILFTTDKTITTTGDMIQMMVNFASDARKEGLLILETKTEDVDDPFVKKGMRMVVDGASQEYVLEVLGAELDAMEERHTMNASIFSSAGAYAPTLGVLGAVFGLIAAMGHIDDTAMMAEAIAAAFIATILGIFTGYVLWNPFATKLKAKSKHEILVKSIAIEGILSIQKGEPPNMVKDKLLSLLSQSEQQELSGTIKI